MYLFLDSNFGLFLGRFHPLVVHLPIGFLFLAGIFHLAGRKPAYQFLKQAIGPTLFLGSCTALLSVVFGLALANDGGYEGDTLFWHKWLGIGVMVFSALAWLVHTERLKALASGKSLLLGLVVLLLLFTGHLGGNLTHGEGYLLQHAPGFVKALFGQKQEGESQSQAAEMAVDSILVYTHILQPVLDQKCISCHNDKKQNGGLNMSTQELLLQGGDHGEVLMAGKALESELFHRVTMNRESEKFMPPKGQPLTFDEIKILEWWINKGMSFDTYLGEIDIPDDIKTILLRSYGVDAVKRPYVEKIEVPAINDSIATEITSHGFTLTPLAENNNLLEITAPDSLTKEMLEPLLQAKEQITWLNFGESHINDEMLSQLASFPNLTRLRLQKNEITDVGVTHLANLPHLESLNLYGTQMTDQCLETLKTMPALQRVFLWQTNVSQEAVDALKSERPELEVDMGFRFSEGF